MWWSAWPTCSVLLLGGCVLGRRVLSPELDAAGGLVGKIGGGGDSIALWMTTGVLGIIALLAYPTQRMARLAWNSWRGRSGPRKGKGRDVCIKFSEWDS